MVSEKVAAERLAGLTSDAYNLDSDQKRAIRNVSQWMRGFNVERPTKSEFDRAYSVGIEYLDDPVMDQVEAAAMRAGREQATFDARQGYSPQTPIGYFNEPHRKGHHKGICDAACRRGRRAHAHSRRNGTHR